MSNYSVERFRESVVTVSVFLFTTAPGVSSASIKKRSNADLICSAVAVARLNIGHTLRKFPESIPSSESTFQPPPASSHIKQYILYTISAKKSIAFAKFLSFSEKFRYRILHAFTAFCCACYTIPLFFVIRSLFCKKIYGFYCTFPKRCGIIILLLIL